MSPSIYRQVEMQFLCKHSALLHYLSTGPALVRPHSVENICTLSTILRMSLALLVFLAVQEVKSWG